ncbi:MAG: acyltransferase domain-containing protein [Acidobacteriota bacterium]
MSVPHPVLLTLSAADAAALDRAATALATHLASVPDLSLPALARSVRAVLDLDQPHRLTVVADRCDAAVAMLTGDDDAQRPRAVYDADAPRPVAFLCSGQGSQYAGMARDLYTRIAAFRQAIDTCAEALLEPLGADLRALLYPDDPTTDAAAEAINQTRITQPALFAIEYATAQLWRQWGVVPTAMIGHSVGEYVAAQLAGVFELEQALALVAKRGALMQALPSGAMLAVPLDEEPLRAVLPDDLSIAAFNARRRSVVSGPHEAIDAFRQAMRAERVMCRPLHTSHAFHSAMMDPILPAFTEAVAACGPQPPTIPYVSNLTGDWITADDAARPGYWAEHLRGAVRFAEGAGRLFDVPDRLSIEVGPGNTLVTLMQRHPARGDDHPLLHSICHPKERGQADDLAVLLRALGAAWRAGAAVDWTAVDATLLSGGADADRTLTLPASLMTALS